ncbi:MAG: prepilin-type N-terminal cleavage/methylation domain-containing protein [Nitrospira sp.]|nr:prepilin-type N-terminal cleavage/methylation domain-containing protein [Nitrospira sp.]
MKVTGHRSGALNAAGFTLLEVMIALAIIAMTVTVILHTVNYHADIMYENTLSTKMFQIAKEKMLELEMENTASKGVISTTEITYETKVSETDDPEIIELRATITGHGKKITLSELVRKKEEF